MKKLFALLLTFVLLISGIALAETVDYSTYTDEDLATLTATLIAELKTRGKTPDAILDLTKLTDDELVALAEAILAEQTNRGYTAPRETLQKGSKGEAVKALQLRLIELNYLSGSADGDYGNKTVNAVTMFQTAAGLTSNGIADDATQDALFAEDAPKAKVYLDLDFKAISRDPDMYEGKDYKFSGKVLQVMEEEYNGSTLVSLRVATKGNYDNVVYIVYIREAGESRILEDDRVTVYGTCQGLYSYESTSGKEVTLPLFMGETVTLN